MWKFPNGNVNAISFCFNQRHNLFQKWIILSLLSFLHFLDGLLQNSIDLSDSHHWYQFHAFLGGEGWTLPKWTVYNIFACQRGCQPLDDDLELQVASEYPTPPIAGGHSRNLLNIEARISLENLSVNGIHRKLGNFTPIEVDSVNGRDVLHCSPVHVQVIFMLVSAH